MRPSPFLNRSARIAGGIACLIALAACGSSGTITATGDPVPSNGSSSGAGGAIGSDDPGAEDQIPDDAGSGNEPATSTGAVSIGTSGSIGDWEVTITGWTPDATDQVVSANEVNGPPENGAYGLVSMTATYRGDTEGSAWFELTFGLAGGDGQEFRDTGCNALEADGLVDQPSVRSGDTVSADVCLDFDPASLDGATLFVEETISLDDQRLVWSPS